MLKNQRLMDDFKKIVWEEFESQGIARKDVTIHFKRTPYMTVYEMIYDVGRYALTFPLMMIHMPWDYQQRVATMTCINCIDEWYENPETLYDECVKDRKSGRFKGMCNTYLECALMPYVTLNADAEMNITKHLSRKVKGLLKRYGFTLVFVGNPNWNGDVLNKMFRTIIIDAQRYEHGLETMEELAMRTERTIAEMLKDEEEWTKDREGDE